MPEIKSDSAETCDLLEKAGKGDRLALDQLLARHRPKLRSFVAVRLGPDLQARVDASDIVQEAQVEIARRLEDFMRRRPVPFHVWVRKTARLLNIQRHHV